MSRRDEEYDDGYYDDLTVSVDLIDDGLYLGNLSCAWSGETVDELKITHILTVDVFPVPMRRLDRPNITFYYVKLAHAPKEDLISRLPEINGFIKQAIASGGIVFVHSFFGGSRSAASVISYVMEKYGLCYDEAYTLVKSKRRFVKPNKGFIAQLKLFGYMGYSLNQDDPRYKQFRLKLARQKLKEVKILPQLFADLVKQDPGLVRESLDSVVYRCKKCRRIVASQQNIIPHVFKRVKVELAKKGMQPPASKLTGLNSAEDGEIVLNLKSLASQLMEMSCDDADDSAGQGRNQQDGDEGPSQVLDGYSEKNMVHGDIAARADLPEVCRHMWFVEPMTWMRDVTHHSGKLHCPKCLYKIGSFSWIVGCKCPCGQKVAPAFYLLPSRVEWCNAAQNVQVTL